jgi:flagellar motor protein MotB
LSNTNSLQKKPFPSEGLGCLSFNQLNYLAKRKLFPIPKLKEFARQLEMNQDRNFSLVEIKGKQMYGYDFHRQMD